MTATIARLLAELVKCDAYVKPGASVCLTALTPALNSQTQH